MSCDASPVSLERRQWVPMDNPVPLPAMQRRTAEAVQAEWGFTMVTSQQAKVLRDKDYKKHVRDSRPLRI